MKCTTALRSCHVLCMAESYVIIIYKANGAHIYICIYIYTYVYNPCINPGTQPTSTRERTESLHNMYHRHYAIIGQARWSAMHKNTRARFPRGICAILTETTHCGSSSSTEHGAPDSNFHLTSDGVSRREIAAQRLPCSIHVRNIDVDISCVLCFGCLESSSHSMNSFTSWKVCAGFQGCCLACMLWHVKAVTDRVGCMR